MECKLMTFQVDGSVIRDSRTGSTQYSNACRAATHDRRQNGGTRVFSALVERSEEVRSGLAR